MQKEDCANCRILYRDWNNVVRECECSCHVGQEKPEIPPEIDLVKERKKMTARRASTKLEPKSKKMPKKSAGPKEPAPESE